MFSRSHAAVLVCYSCPVLVHAPCVDDRLLRRVLTSQPSLFRDPRCEIAITEIAFTPLRPASTPPSRCNSSILPQLDHPPRLPVDNEIKVVPAKQMASLEFGFTDGGVLKIKDTDINAVMQIHSKNQFLAAAA